MTDGPGFELKREDDGCVMLYVTDWWSPEAEQALDVGKADGLVMGYTGGFKDYDLAFIKDWPLKRVRLVARSVKDLSPLYRLSKTLEHLNVWSAPTAKVDLSRFPRLTHLSASWSQVRDSIGELSNLKDLYLESYKETDFEPLRWNPTIERLRLKERPSVVSLRGVENLVALKFLGVYGSRNLSDIESLREVAGDRLDELHLDGCRSIQGLEPVSHLRSLVCLDAADCGEIQSLRPIEELHALEYLWLWGTTKIVDGDLSPIANLRHLKDLRLAPRRFYQPSVEYLEALVSERNQKAANDAGGSGGRQAESGSAVSAQPKRDSVVAAATSMERLSLVAPKLVDSLRVADSASRRRAAYVAASMVVNRVGLDDSRVVDALDRLRQGDTDELLLMQLNDWASKLDDQYFAVEEAYEDDLVEEEEVFEAFHRARAVSVICSALHQNDLYAAVESIYEAYSAFDEGDKLLEAVANRDA